MPEIDMSFGWNKLVWVNEREDILNATLFKME
jgi:hypothetical protein